MPQRGFIVVGSHRRKSTSFRSIKLLWVELSADPLQHSFVFLVLWVADRFKEVAVAPDPAAILWRASTLTLQAQRILGLGINRWATLDQDLVFPRVAKFVLLFEGETLAGLGENLAQHRRCGAFAVEVLKAVFEQFGNTIAPALDLELMEMGVGPAHCGLDVFVERAVWDLNSSPDRRLDSSSVNLNW